LKERDREGEKESGLVQTLTVWGVYDGFPSSFSSSASVCCYSLHLYEHVRRWRQIIFLMSAHKQTVKRELTAIKKQ